MTITKGLWRTEDGIKAEVVGTTALNHTNAARRF